MCPNCGSLERQRLAWLYMSTETDLLSRTHPKRVLHVSPDRSLYERLAAEPHIAQLTADLNPVRVMVAMDIQDIHYPDHSFDVVYCSHVLEHVPDDRRAMSEILRVLAPRGWAMLQVPLRRGATDEEVTLSNEAERVRRFGQNDHLRYYGVPDYQNRLAQAGFHVTVDSYPRRIGRRAAARFGLTWSEDTYLCHQPANGRGVVVHPVSDLIDAGDRSPGGVVGRVEQVSADNVVRGWAWQPAAPSRRLQIRIMIDGQEVGSGPADRRRESLARAGIGDGARCFGIKLPHAKRGPQHLRIEAEGGAALPPAAEFSIDVGAPDPPFYILDVNSGGAVPRAIGTRVA